MQPLGKRVWLLMALGLMAIPVTAAGVAYACTALATINTSSGSAAQGATVTVNGKYFAPHDANQINTSPALVRMDTVDGPVLAQASPSSNQDGGKFSVGITVPNVSPGEHVVIVTQTGVNGAPAYGTPARTVLMVEPAPAAAASSAAAPVAAAAPLGAPFVARPNPAAAAKPKAKAKAKKMTLKQRVASCKSKNKLTSAKTKKGRKRVAVRRASCIKIAVRSARAARA